MSDFSQQTSIPGIQPAVGGWLLMLCLVLVFVSPASAIYSVGQVLPKLWAATSVSRAVILSVYCVTFLAIAICSIWAGLKLWLVHPRADKFAQKFFMGYIAANIAYFAFWFVLSRPAGDLSLAQIGWDHVVRPIGSAAVWYSYLEYSKRVRSTYPPG